MKLKLEPVVTFVWEYRSWRRTILEAWLSEAIVKVAFFPKIFIKIDRGEGGGQTVCAVLVLREDGCEVICREPHVPTLLTRIEGKMQITLYTEVKPGLTLQRIFPATYMFSN